MAHSRSTQPCEIKDLQDFKPLTGQQILRLKKREHNGLGEEERWKNIYNICFPNADQIPSPCKSYARLLISRRMILIFREVVNANYELDHVCYYDRVLNDVRRSLIHEITHLRRDNNTIPIFADGETASQEVAQHVDNFIRPRIFRDITRNSELNFAPQVFVNSSSRVPECHTMTSASVMDGGGLESQGFRSGTHDSTFTSTFSSDHYLQNQNQSPTLTNGNENVEWPAPVPVPSNANMLPLAAAQYFCDFPEGQTQYGLGQGADQSLVQQNISDRFGEETMDDSMPQFGFGQGGLSQCELCGRSRNGNGNGNGNRVMDDSRFQFGQLQGEPSQCSSCGGNRNATGNGTWA
ncbi:uncharacterized protein LY89DRAFT_325245 [Mollisia scopiformis]|uniref:Uncharacterized protein n=1 Tax=Mollisia scopiformis TaxID=149040 RepID=A0A132B9Q2_MOLSC|nr:uncharacterized protein LY89DRAFT_325245 [Mollisia scopiformis]KUJ08729.1 hypothetical protein LY89DRAFT_325245 [Mollisia scopiformis]